MAKDYRLKLKGNKLILEPLKVPQPNHNRPKDIHDKFLALCPKRKNE